MPSPKHSEKKIAQIVGDAGGEVIGRTRLQKLAFLLELTGLGDGFEFEYRHYGPYSEELAEAAHRSALLGLLSEEEREASWGGSYSIFRSTVSGEDAPKARRRLAKIAVQADAIELELAATAAFLAEETDDPWTETVRRKPQKAAEGRLSRAKELYKKLAEVEAPKPLPKIV